VPNIDIPGFLLVSILKNLEPACLSGISRCIQLKKKNSVQELLLGLRNIFKKKT